MKNEKINFGFKYEFNDDWKDYYNDLDNVGYYYAVPNEGTNNVLIGDCWIVNKNLEVHPGFENSPVPHHINDFCNKIKIESSFPHQKDEQIDEIINSIIQIAFDSKDCHRRPPGV